MFILVLGWFWFGWVGGMGRCEGDCGFGWLLGAVFSLWWVFVIFWRTGMFSVLFLGLVHFLCVFVHWCFVSSVGMVVGVFKLGKLQSTHISFPLSYLPVFPIIYRGHLLDICYLPFIFVTNI